MNYTVHFLFSREHGQGTTEELRSRDFRKDLEEREREKDKSGRRPQEIRDSGAQYVKDLVIIIYIMFSFVAVAF